MGSTTSYSSSGCALNMCTWVTCCASRSSSSLVGLSKMRNKRSNRDKSAAGRLMFSTGETLGLYRPYRGFAAARMDVRAFKVVDIPAFEMEMVCCSMTSWIAVLSVSSILSNSSMQQMPLSARTKAPPSAAVSGQVFNKTEKEPTKNHLVGNWVSHDRGCESNS